eukprot:4990795-Pleurochrysis_carterae.AAC.1
MQTAMGFSLAPDALCMRPARGARPERLKSARLSASHAGGLCNYATRRQKCSTLHPVANSRTSHGRKRPALASSSWRDLLRPPPRGFSAAFYSHLFDMSGYVPLTIVLMRLGQRHHAHDVMKRCVYLTSLPKGGRPRRAPQSVPPP